MDNKNYHLTSQDIKALKHADTICFDWSNEGTSQIRAIQERQHSSTGFEQSHEIPCNVRFNLYRDSETSRYQQSDSRIPKHAFAMKYASDEIIRTVIDLLRADDILTLTWHSHSDGYLKGSSCHLTTETDGIKYVIANGERLWADDLHIIIERDGGRKTKTMEFIISHSNCVENSAKMIKMY